MIQMERLMQKEVVRCFVLITSNTDTFDRADWAMMRDMAETTSIRPLPRMPASDKPQSKLKAISSRDANPSTSQ